MQKNYCSHCLSTHRPQESDLFLITSRKKKINQISSLKTTKEQSEITLSQYLSCTMLRFNLHCPLKLLVCKCTYQVNSFTRGAAWSGGNRALDLQFGGPKFKFCPDSYCRLICSWSTMLVNSQLVCLQPAGILNPIMFNLNCLCQKSARPTSITAINTAKGIK